MKIIFKKNENSEISVFQNIDGQEEDFSYVGMIKTLIDSNKLIEPDILGEFSEAEKKSINSMVTLINKEISTSNKPEPNTSKQ